MRDGDWQRQRASERRARRRQALRGGRGAGGGRRLWQRAGGGRGRNRWMRPAPTSAQAPPERATASAGASARREMLCTARHRAELWGLALLRGGARGRARGGLLLHPAPSAVVGGPAPARRCAGPATRSSPLSQVVCGRAARVRVVDVLPAVVAGGLRPPGEAVGSACAAARSCAAASACIPATTTRAAAAATRRAAAEVAARTRGRALHEQAGAVRSRGAPSESARESEGGKARGATRAGEATGARARSHLSRRKPRELGREAYDAISDDDTAHMV